MNVQSPFERLLRGALDYAGRQDLITHSYGLPGLTYAIVGRACLSSYYPSITICGYIGQFCLDDPTHAPYNPYFEAYHSTNSMTLPSESKLGVFSCRVPQGAESLYQAVDLVERDSIPNLAVSTSPIIRLENIDQAIETIATTMVVASKFPPILIRRSGLAWKRIS